MTELEGAILGVLREGQNVTPYAVRRIFQASLSVEWSGSAGAIYPAIRRLESSGLITAKRQKDGRGTKVYALSGKGTAAHDAWLCDVARATGPGMDPFRTRAALWAFLPPARRRKLLKALEVELRARREAHLRQIPELDAADRLTRGLVMMQLDARLTWLKTQM